MAKEFDESKHPRAKDGTFTSKDGVKEYRQNASYDEIVGDSGAKSGALDSDGKDKERADKHAALMYETFRNIKSDIPKIAKITGYSKKQISDIKNYVFNNKEFFPDYDQAQTWDRLRKGEPIEADIIFLKHELMEMEYRQKGYSYEDAHEFTEKLYNYQKAIKEYKDGLFRKN